MEEKFCIIEKSAHRNAWQEYLNRLRSKSFNEELTIKAARKNASQNRYRDVNPYDHTRVILESDDDYINANYVEYEETESKYILCQGPLPHTCNKFWQMVWEQNSLAIIMVTNLIEGNTRKCSPYWPQTECDSFIFGDFKVKLCQFINHGAFIISDISLENLKTGEIRIIKHFHYKAWPDFGIPNNSFEILRFLALIRSSKTLFSAKLGHGPAVVHCSAGIGRSGVFICLDIVLKLVEQGHSLDSIDFDEILLCLRKQRMGLIQSHQQLRFTYIAIIDGAKYISSFEGLNTLLMDMDDIENIKPPPPVDANESISNDVVPDLPPPPPPPTHLLRQRPVDKSEKQKLLQDKIDTIKTNMKSFEKKEEFWSNYYYPLLLAGGTLAIICVVSALVYTS